MTRTDFHRNLFYYYRGPLTNRHFASQQLENNTTKALINVLDNTGPVVTKEFLRWLGVDTVCEPVDFALQTETIGQRRIKGAKDRRLLEIVGGQPAKSAESLSEPTTGSSLPDAWIYNDDVVILVESKLGSNSDLNQRARHMSLLGSNIRPIERTWQQIHDFFLSVPELSGVDLDRFLARQFTKYLEYTSMATAKTVDEELFDFLFHPEDDRGKSWVRETMKGLATSVKDAVDRSLQVKVGNLQKQEGGGYSCWVTLARSPRASEEAHLTIELLPYELSIYANVDTATVQKLMRGLGQAPGTFKALLVGLEGFDISIYDRRPMQPLKFEYVPVLRFKTGRYIEDDYSFNHIANLLKRLRAPGTYPSFSVARAFNRHEVVAMKDKLADTLAEVARSLQPVVHFINEDAS